MAKLHALANLALSLVVFALAVLVTFKTRPSGLYAAPGRAYVASTGPV